GTAARSHREHGHTSAGAVLLTVTVTPEDTEVFPAASRATAAITCMPPSAVVVSHARVYGADDCSGPAFTLSILNCTPATPTSSDAAADKATVPETVAPSIGAVIDTAGGVVSLAGAASTSQIVRLNRSPAGAVSEIVTAVPA